MRARESNFDVQDSVLLFLSAFGNLTFYLSLMTGLARHGLGLQGKMQTVPSTGSYTSETDKT